MKRYKYGFLWCVYLLDAHKISSETPREKAQIMRNELTRRETNIDPSYLHEFNEKKAKFNKHHSRMMSERGKIKKRKPVNHVKELEKMESLLKETERMIK